MSNCIGKEFFGVLGVGARVGKKLLANLKAL